INNLKMAKKAAYVITDLAHIEAIARGARAARGAVPRPDSENLQNCGCEAMSQKASIGVSVPLLSHRCTIHIPARRRACVRMFQGRCRAAPRHCACCRAAKIVRLR